MSFKQFLIENANRIVKYIGGKVADTSTVSWKSGGGDLQLTIVRNAKLATNGYLPNLHHSIDIVVGGKQYSFYMEKTIAPHGYCILLNGGKITVKVPEDVKPNVQRLIGEYNSHNDKIDKELRQENSAYIKQRQKIIDALKK